MKNKKYIFLGLLVIGIIAVAGCDTKVENSTATIIPTTTTQLPTTTAVPTTIVPTTAPITVPTEEPTTTVTVPTDVPTETGTTITTTTTSLYEGNYYSSVDETLRGEAFISELTTLVNDGFKSLSYDAAYSALTYTDQDPAGSSKVMCLYTGVLYDKGTNGNDRKWNREHVWAKSHGFNDKSYDAYSDIHHLRATEMGINSTRGNLDFDEVSNYSSSYSKDNYGNKWISGTCFEPRDEVKGDVARIMFYMVAKYNSSSLDLSLVDRINTSGTQFGRLSTLIKWHWQDPVDEYEMRRNDRIYAGNNNGQYAQGNRNPFIDHPEYVEYAFGKVDVPSNPGTGTTTKPTESAPTATTPSIEATDSVTVDFTANNFSDAAFTTTGKTMTFGSYNVYLSSYYISARTVRLGHNKTGVDLSKFNISDKGAYMTCDFSVDNMTGFTLNASQTYSGTNKWYAYYTPANSTSYELIGQGSISSTNITGQFSSAVSGKLTLVFTAYNARLDLNNLVIYKK